MVPVSNNTTTGDGGTRPVMPRPIISPGESSHQSRNDLPLKQTSPPTGEPSRKRPMVDSRASMLYPRKRAVTACQQCRTRKVKCNNERPTCSACSVIGAKCSYETQADCSSFDPASLMILDKLNEVIERLDNHERSLGNLHFQSFNDSTELIAVNPPAPPTPALNLASGPTPRTLPGQDIDEEHLHDLDSCTDPSSALNADSILRWPIFEGRFPPDYLIEELFISSNEPVAQTSEPIDLTRSNTRGLMAGILDEDAPELVRRFLELVHVKNPILEPKTIGQYARRVSEDGPGWDAPSCLVLLACALGLIAKPITADPNLMDDNFIKSPQLDAQVRRAAENYHQLARKRFGLLNNDILACQCYILSGVYNMYTIRPLQGWRDFNQASVTYCIYIKGQIALRERSPSAIHQPSSALRRLEQSLFWTCFKSECEFREELCLPDSGIFKLRYPHMFPSPPNPRSPAEGEHIGGLVQQERLNSSLSFASSPSAELQEQSWYYYLTEIAFRRIGNRILNTLYSSDHTSWNQDNILKLLRMAEYFEVEIEAWQNSLPEPISFSENDNGPSQSADELRCMVRARYLALQTWIYRPFLYYVIHNPVAEHDPGGQAMRRMAHKALFNCVKWQYSNSGITHRHHGTWYGCRSVVSHGLLLIAAKKSKNIDIPNSWAQDMRVIINSLRYWENDATPDVRKGRELLEILRRECNP